MKKKNNSNEFENMNGNVKDQLEVMGLIKVFESSWKFSKQLFCYYEVHNRIINDKIY